MASSASVTPKEQSPDGSTYTMVKEQSDDTSPSDEEDPAEALSTSSTTSYAHVSVPPTGVQSRRHSGRPDHSIAWIEQQKGATLSNPHYKNSMGQHIELDIGQPIPGVTNPRIFAHTSNSLVEVVEYRRITVVVYALKRTHLQNLEGNDHLSALQEVRSLSQLRHAHIVQLVGTHLQGNRFNMLLYTEAQYDLADCHGVLRK